MIPKPEPHPAALGLVDGTHDWSRQVLAWAISRELQAYYELRALPDYVPPTLPAPHWLLTTVELGGPTWPVDEAYRRYLQARYPVK